VCFLDPIWLIASVEEGGLMGITQQLDQCHSLGMNVHQPQQMTSEMGMQPSNNLLYQTSSTNPFQSTRCKENCFLNKNNVMRFFPRAWFRSK
jgi:hypothetical protein